MKKAGYPPQALVNFFKKLETVQTGPNPLPLLSTHPPTPDRIARLEEMIAGKQTSDGVMIP